MKRLSPSQANQNQHWKNNWPKLISIIQEQLVLLNFFMVFSRPEENLIYEPVRSFFQNSFYNEFHMKIRSAKVDDPKILNLAKIL